MGSGDRTPQIDNAHRLVGRFLQHFALVEAAIDNAIGKLFSLERSANAILAANMPFTRKVDTLFSGEKELAAMPEVDRKRFLKDVRSKILAMNDNRIIAAHSSFDADERGGVVFRRVSASRELKIADVEWTEKQVEQWCAELTGLVGNIELLIEQMTPFEGNSLDFSDGRNSGYLSLI